MRAHAHKLSHAYAVARRPPAAQDIPPGWAEELVSACEDRFEEFDAPAYALVMHALGRLHCKPPVGWLQVCMGRPLIRVAIMAIRWADIRTRDLTFLFSSSGVSLERLLLQEVDSSQRQA